jgi:hypothetical protein
VEEKNHQTRIVKSSLPPDSIIAAASIPVTETITRLVKPEDSETQLNARVEAEAKRARQICPALLEQLVFSLSVFCRNRPNQLNQHPGESW